MCAYGVCLCRGYACLHVCLWSMCAVCLFECLSARVFLVCRKSRVNARLLVCMCWGTLCKWRPEADIWCLLQTIPHFTEAGAVINPGVMTTLANPVSRLALGIPGFSLSPRNLCVEISVLVLMFPRVLSLSLDEIS